MNIQELIKNYESAPFAIVSVNTVLKDLKQLDKPQPIKLKDVIARIEKFDLGTKAVWINEILYKLGSDYGLHKYYAGYKQGKFDGTMKREKVTVPQFAGDFIAEQKKQVYTLSESIDACMSDRVAEWYWDNSELFARAWLDGYTVEKEKRYTVKITKTDQYLYSRDNDFFFVTYVRPDDNPHNCHTRKELEDAGFGWVFDCPGIETEEVE